MRERLESDWLKNLPSGGERWLPVVPASYLPHAHLHLHLEGRRQGEVRHRRGLGKGPNP